MKKKKTTSNVLSQNEVEEGSDIIIEIDEEKDLPLNKLKKKKEKMKKPQKKANKFLSGYNPFIFYEKEKFKEANFKEIKQTEYVKQLAAKWKNMSEEEKAPYVTMALEFKREKLAKDPDYNKPSNPKKKKIINKKRKRINTREKKKYIEIEEENSKKRVKKKCLTEKSNVNSSSTCDKRCKSEVKKNKNNDSEEEEDLNGYVCSVLVPFVEKSFIFFKNKGLLKGQ
jgi:hypothetical protein